MGSTSNTSLVLCRFFIDENMLTTLSRNKAERVNLADLMAFPYECQDEELAEDPYESH
jgi:hypothetical protein